MLARVVQKVNRAVEDHRIGRVSQNWLEMWERYVMLARTTNPRGILMLNLSMMKDMKWQTYRMRLVMIIF